MIYFLYSILTTINFNIKGINRTCIGGDVYQRYLTERQLPQAVVKAIYAFPYSLILCVLSVAQLLYFKVTNSCKQTNIYFFVRVG